jgi:hypothetical protein
MLVRNLNAISLQQFDGQIRVDIQPGENIMSVIGKWALQAVVMFLFAWLATVVAQWSGGIVKTNSSDRLAALSSVRYSTDAVAVSVNKKAQGSTIVVGSLGQGNE